MTSDGLPVGEEPLSPHNISNYAILRHNGISLLSLPNGEIDSRRREAESTGMYHRDARYLSRLSLSLGEVRPSLLDARVIKGEHSLIYTNPAMHSLVGDPVIPPQTLVLRRHRLIYDCLLETITISNYGLEPVGFELRLEFDMDFTDVFEVRGYKARRTPGPISCLPLPGGVRFSQVGADGVERVGTVSFEPRPKAPAERSAAFDIKLLPGATTTLTIRVAPEDRHGDCDEAGAKAARAVERDRRDDECASFECDNELLNVALEQCMDDLLSLRTHTPEFDYVAAGVPWFDTLFGRDSLITGMQLLAWDASTLRMALEVLGRYQADADDPVYDAQPGKIPHELRWGELANIGEVPFGKYYGSVDATPLYVWAAWEYYRWTGDERTIRNLWPVLERAIEWCVRQLEESPHGCLSYARVSANGLENQGWKDSSDAIVWPDGRLVDPAIALIEVHGYAIAAFEGLAKLGAALGLEPTLDCERQAELLRGRGNKLFSDPVLGYVLCLDGSGRRVATAASNAGHMLWAGAAGPEQAALVAKNLLSEHMFSGWGVRTLGSNGARYNPLGYHLGTVWPHDNALIVAGLRRYGHDREAERLGVALLESASAFPDARMPELFSGDGRDLRAVPTPFPVASRPQAWSAASVPYTITSMLGVDAAQPGQLAITRPLLPPGVEWAHLRNVRFGGGSVDLMYRRGSDGVEVDVESITGSVQVALPDGRCITR